MKYIFHIDVNSAFLSWTAVKRLQEDPSAVDLRQVPSAVGGDVETRHGIITAKSIPAKKYGVTTGEPVVKALQKCPDLILVSSDFETYRKFSHQFIHILKSYTDAVEQASIDEAYMDVSGVIEGFRGERTPAGDEAAFALADRIRNEIRDSLSFTVNVGISVNKLLAKTASDFQKPDKIHTLYPEEVPAKLWTLPLAELHGCGPNSTKKLAAMGIYTVGEAAHTDLALLQQWLGEKAGEYIFESANGRGSENVHTEERDAKSISNELTTSADINEENYETDADRMIRHLTQKVAGRLKKYGFYAGTLGVSVKTEDFHRHSRQTGLPESTDDAEKIYQTCRQLLDGISFGEAGLLTRGHAYRLIGVTASGLDKGEYRQVSLFDYMDSLPEQTEKTEQTPQDVQRAKQKQDSLQKMMEQIQNRYGKDSIQKGGRR